MFGVCFFFFWVEVDTSLLVSFGGRGLGIFVLKVLKPDEDSEVQHMVLKAGKQLRAWVISLLDFIGPAPESGD